MPKLEMHSSQASSSRLSSATYPTLQHKCCLHDSFNAASIQRSALPYHLLGTEIHEHIP